MLYVTDYTLPALKAYPQFQFKLIDLFPAGAERLVLHNYSALTIQHGWLPSQPPASQTHLTPPASQTHLTSCCLPNYYLNQTQTISALQCSTLFLNNFSSRGKIRDLRNVPFTLSCVLLIWGKTPKAVTPYTNQLTSAAIMVRTKISYLQALMTDLSCRGAEDSLSGAPDAKFTKSGSPLCCGEKSSRTRRVSLLWGIYWTDRHRDMYISACIGTCCLRTLLRPHHCLDRVHSVLNNMLFVQYVDRESRYNMWSRVKALLSHSFTWMEK